MSIIATLEALRDAGATPDMLIAVVRAHEAERARIAAERKAKDAQRKREERQKASEMSADVHGHDRTSRDSDGPSPRACEGDARVVNPTSSSLRSEEAYPPVTPSGVTAPKGAPSPKAKRGSRRVPADWEPSARTYVVLTDEGHSPGDLERALTRMRDHEFRTPRSDWDAAFRNWVRGDADRKPRQAHDRPSHDEKFERRQANLARAFASPGRAAGPRWDP